MHRPSVAVAIATVVALAVSLSVVEAGARSHAHYRKGLMIGFGVGGGLSGIDVNDIDTEEHERGLAGALRLGIGVKPHLVAGLEATAWRNDDHAYVDGVQVDATVTFNVTGVALTWFPDPDSGVFLRGGVGIGRYAFDIDVDETISVGLSDTGYGVLLGAGNEWRLTRLFALGTEIDFAWFSTSEFPLLDEFDRPTTAEMRAHYLNLNLTATWYFRR